VIEIFSEAKSLKRSISLLIFLVLFSVAGAGLASAQCPQSTIPATNFCLSGVGNGNSLDGIYVSPYQALINGVPTYVICDDFEDDVNLYETWTATSGTVGSSTVGLFGSESSAQYAQVAWLAGQLITNLPTLTSYQQDLLSYSIWSVFDPGTAPTSMNPGGTGVQGWLDSNPSGGLTYAAVQAEVALAPTSGNFSNVTVYTPVTGTESCCGRPQEFLTVSTPEAPSAANLAVDFLGLGVLLFGFQRYRLARR
jgi:hypothetical protein